MRTYVQQSNVPVQPAQRIKVIDIVRGFAIFGILLVNMEFFNNSVLAHLLGLNQPENVMDQFGCWFIAFLAA